jgi:hypothetical protein
MDYNDENLPHQEPSEEDIRLENEILKLKMQAEFGASFHQFSGDFSPELEQQFLQHVYNFEKDWGNGEMTTVAELMGNPGFRPFEQIPEEERATALENVISLYLEKKINLHFIYDYPIEVKYRFATEELPLQQTMVVNVPGMIQGYVYEEYHPNHPADMEETLRQFLKGWFDQDIEKCLHELSGQLILSDGRLVDQSLVSTKLKQFFESFTSLEETDFFIAETSFESTGKGEAEPMLGFVEGAIHWDATMETGETIAFAGPFKFYLEYAEYWSIFNFIMPAFTW